MAMQVWVKEKRGIELEIHKTVYLLKLFAWRKLKCNLNPWPPVGLWEVATANCSWVTEVS